MIFAYNIFRAVTSNGNRWWEEQQRSVCPPTVRMRGLIPAISGITNIGSPNLPRDVPADKAAQTLDEFLGEQQWSETSRQTSSEVIGGVTIERIDRITFERPSGERTTLILDHPPLDNGGPMI